MLLLGVSQFLRALLFSAGLGGDEIFNPAESLQEKSAFNYCSLLRAEVKEQGGIVHETHLRRFRATEICDEGAWTLQPNIDIGCDAMILLKINSRQKPN